MEKVQEESDLAAAVWSGLQSPHCLFQLRNTAPPRSLLAEILEFPGQRPTGLGPDGTWKSNCSNANTFGKTAGSDAPVMMQADQARFYFKSKLFTHKR
jgi:hypothetical protein